MASPSWFQLRKAGAFLWDCGIKFSKVLKEICEVTPNVQNPCLWRAIEMKSPNAGIWALCPGSGSFQVGVSSKLWFPQLQWGRGTQSLSVKTQ